MEPIMRTIAYVRNERRELVDDNWDDYVSAIELADDVPTSSLRGLEEFSHVEIVFFAQLAENVPPGPWHRHPRGNPEWPDVGIFAQRNKDRPNRLMLSVGGRRTCRRALDRCAGPRRHQRHAGARHQTRLLLERSARRTARGVLERRTGKELLLVRGSVPRLNPLAHFFTRGAGRGSQAADGHRRRRVGPTRRVKDVNASS